MYVLESLQPNCAEICCTHDVLHIKPQSKNTLYPKVKFRTDAGNKQEATENCQNILTVKERRVSQ